MIDLHTHTLLSDGELIPSELVRRAEAAGYKAIALTDHVDASNLHSIIKKTIDVSKALNESQDVIVIPGVEITHVPPKTIAGLVDDARTLGALIVVVHGETIAEPVMKGTNRAAIEAGADILAHPGLISEDDTRLAREKGILLEISGRQGHSLTNGHVAAISRRIGASLIINTDAHSHHDLITLEMAKNLAIGAGIIENDVDEIFEKTREYIEKFKVQSSKFKVENKK